MGFSILDDLRASLDRDRIARYLADYGAVTGYDGSFRHLLRATGGVIDLRSDPHRVAVIDWLRAWGCRHLRRTDTRRTAEALGTWWEEWAERVPGEQANLAELGDAELQAAGQAYDAARRTCGWAQPERP